MSRKARTLALPALELRGGQGRCKCCFSSAKREEARDERTTTEQRATGQTFVEFPRREAAGMRARRA